MSKGLLRDMIIIFCRHTASAPIHWFWLPNLVLTAEKIGDSPIKSDMKLGPQTHVGAESQSNRTIQLVPKSWKMAIIIPRRRGVTWQGVPVATWWCEWICRMRGGLVHHTIMIPVALSLPLLRGACSRSFTDNISKLLVFNGTRISNF